MKRLVSLLLTVVMLMSMLASVPVSTKDVYDHSADFTGTLYILDTMYIDTIGYFGGYEGYVYKKISNVLFNTIENARVVYIKSDDLRSLYNTYFEMNDALYEAVLALTEYDPVTDTYKFGYNGGAGGALPARGFIGYKKNGSTYDVYYAEKKYSFLADVMPDYYEYREAHGYPHIIEYKGVVYTGGPGGHKALTEVLNSGKKYTVEYAQADYSINVTYRPMYKFLSDVLPEGVVESEYAASLGNPEVLEYAGVEYTYNYGYECYVGYYSENDPEEGTATIAADEEIVRILGWSDYTKADLPATFDHVDSTNKFVDLEVKSWSKGSIDYVVAHGYMSGTGTGSTFDQEGTMTRAMIVSVLWRIAGSPEPTIANPFRDLQANQTWYHKAVVWANETGIVAGTTPTTFAPTASVTREQMAAFLFRFASYMGYNTDERADLSAFPDNGSVSFWSKDALSWANAKGLVSGAVIGSQTVLNPNGEATREQVASILERFCKAFVE